MENRRLKIRASRCVAEMQLAINPAALRLLELAELYFEEGDTSRDSIGSMKAISRHCIDAAAKLLQVCDDKSKEVLNISGGPTNGN